MKVTVFDLVARHKAGANCGMYSVCSAHPLVITATLKHALRHGDPFVLIEATSNQVNQHGGYTGMTPEGFRDFVLALADSAGLERERVLLGGDHLGPNAWADLDADAAMAKAEVLVSDYVAAGFRKIHLDCSMSCADDPVPLDEVTVAQRAARLCASAEAAWRRTGGEPPAYVIGTEVPVPGGAAEDLASLAVTSADAAEATLEAHRQSFDAAGLGDAFDRVIGLVVQPGVEFDHRKVFDYIPAETKALGAMIERHPRIVFEAHSTDYQQPRCLAQLVADHFAILKVGPGVTFALREALWALDTIEREWMGGRASGFRSQMLALLRDEPHHWQKYYHSKGAALDFDLQYSLSDRIRYYWPESRAVEAVDRMYASLADNPPPLPLLSQYLPAAYAAIRSGEASKDRPDEWVMAHIATVLDAYHAAVTPTGAR